RRPRSESVQLSFSFAGSCSALFMDAVLVAGEASGLHISNVILCRFHHFLAHLRVLFYETWNKRIEKAEGVVAHQYLPVASNSGADSDSGNLQFARDLFRDLHRHRLEHDREGAGVLHCSRVGLYTPGFLLRSAHRTEAAQLMHRLRSQPDVSHHWNAK